MRGGILYGNVLDKVITFVLKNLQTGPETYVVFHKEPILRQQSSSLTEDGVDNVYTVEVILRDTTDLVKSFLEAAT